MPHRMWCSVAQPHSCTKESHTDTDTCLEVDGLATGSSASEKSRSLELLLTLHTWSALLSAVLQRARLEAAAQLEHAARRCRRSSCAATRSMAVHS